MAKSSRKRQQTRTIRSIAVGCCLAAVAVAAALVWYKPNLEPVDPTSKQAKLVHVRAGMSARDITALLAKKRLIRSPAAAYLYCLISGKARKLKAGYYDLSAALSTPELFDVLVSGKIATRRLVIVPGLTLKQIAQRVRRAGFIHADDFLAHARADEYATRVSFPLPEGKTVEGYLFPATYTFPIDLSAHEMISRMLQVFARRFYKPHAEEIAKHPLSLHGLVTLASLVEWEARLDRERPIIAGVLMNRLSRGMRLQCDATVQYALGRHKLRLLYEDLKVQSPYNTYIHRGLPPGPICSPSLASLMAALRPAKHDYLFYVARGDGGHIFTRSYSEHLQAIARLRAAGRRG